MADLGDAAFRYKLVVPIADYHGIGRFVMGLPGEIVVRESLSFKIYLKICNKKVRMTEFVSLKCVFCK